ncbi:MAG TPA: HAMP domain-containing sensor histidine kinase [Gemmatirosa sp.]
MQSARSQSSVPARTNPVPLRRGIADARRSSSTAAARWKFLAEASLALEDSLDYQATLCRVVRLAVPAMADYAAVALRADDGSSSWAATAHRDPASAWLAERLRAYAPRGASGTHPVLRALHGERPQVVRDVDDAFIHAIAHDAEHLALLRSLAPTSYISAPMFARGQVFGALVLFATPASGRRYMVRDVRIAQETARRAALAVDHATLFRAAEHAARTREAVLAMVSHDLKNPLSTIMLAAGFLLEELVPADDAHVVQRHQLQAIARASDRMRRLVGDLLDASALDAGRLRLDVGPHVLSALLEDVREVLAPLATAKGIVLTIEGPADDPVLHADRDRILQVVANLGGNAIKFTPGGGRVAVSAVRTGDAVAFDIVDSGSGISADDLPCVFDRFWQARSTARLGSGLGLAIAKGIVEAHGGSIHAHSVVGEGSTFQFVLPLTRHGPARPAAP